MPDFSDQVVVISGASGNLGVAAAHGFAAAGAKLGLLGRNIERLKSALGELATSSRHMLLAPVDMTEADSVKQAIDKLARHFGRLDVMLNLTGGYRAGTPVHESNHHHRGPAGAQGCRQDSRLFRIQECRDPFDREHGRRVENAGGECQLRPARYDGHA